MSDFTLGKHEQAIQTLLTGQEQMQRDLGEIRDILAERRGERRVGLWLVGAVGTAVSLLVSIGIQVIRQYVKGST